MKRPTYLMVLLCLLANIARLYAQNIAGQVTDKQNQPIAGVAVILQTLDSTYIDAAVTDTLGYFRLNQPGDQPRRLLFQHLLYRPAYKEIAGNDAGTVQLEEKDYRLGEVTVQGERPLLKLEDGKLTYDIPALTKNRTATNAFETIKELPSIVEQGGQLQLVGASRLNIVLNGQPTTMTAEQLIQLLKSMPASRVAKAEISYTTPAKYQVKGALLNILLSKNESATPSWQGETGADYEQHRRAIGKAHVNLLYADKKWNLDFFIDGRKGQDISGEDMLARHTLAGRLVEIDQHNRGKGRFHGGTFRAALDYALNNEDKFSLSYYLRGTKDKTYRTALTSYTERNEPGQITESTSQTRSRDHSATHNIRLQYNSHNDLSAGIDFTRYHAPSTLHYLDTNTVGSQTDLLNPTGQDISRWSLFINHTARSASGWEWNYGLHGGYAVSDNYAEYLYKRNDKYETDPKATEDKTQKEYSADIFAEVSKTFGKRLSATAGLKIEYFKSDYTSLGAKTNLWDEWTFYPTLSLNYTFSPRHMLQFNLSSDKSYPGYWQVTSQSMPVNSYSEVRENPYLKPYRSYEGQLVYILRQKYIFLAFCEYAPDYFTQMPYQSDTELKNTFRFENMDYKLETGFALVVPFRAGQFWNSRVTLRGWRMQQKDDHFQGISYNREAYVGMIHISNSFRLCKKPALSLTLDGQYVTPGSIQGVYDLGSIYAISAGLKWAFLNDRASLTLKGEDIFASGIPRSIKIEQGTQWSRLKKLNDNRFFQISFVWKFGGYQSKKHESVDTSRFGK